MMILAETKHRAASVRQQSYLLRSQSKYRQCLQVQQVSLNAPLQCAATTTANTISDFAIYPESFITIAVAYPICRTVAMVIRGNQRAYLRLLF